MKEPLVTLSLIVMMLLYEITPTQLRFPEKSCTSMKGMDSKQWFDFLFYHHLHKGHLAYNIFSTLWKGILLEGYIGSRQFSLLVLALLFTYDGLIISTRLLGELLGGAEICLPICHTGISGLLLALSFPLNANSQIYRSIIPVPCQNLCTVTLSAIYALEIAVLCSLCTGLPFYGPVCGTLAGLLYSYHSQLFSNLIALFMNRRWLRPVLKNNGTKDSQQLPETTQMVWSCSACTYDNSVTANPYACSICEAPMFEIIGSSDKAGLVWSCPTCTYENGVFFHGCEICGTSRRVSA